MIVFFISAMPFCSWMAAGQSHHGHQTAKAPARNTESHIELCSAEEHWKGVGSPPHCLLSSCALELLQHVPVTSCPPQGQILQPWSHRTALGEMLPVKRGGEQPPLTPSSPPFNMRALSQLSEVTGTTQVPQWKPSCLSIFQPRSWLFCKSMVVFTALCK